MPDDSNGYEAIAREFISARNPAIGTAVVRAWARSLPPGATVLDLGCGNGFPVTATLVECGLAVSAIDASPTMISAFRENFPGVPAACEPAESSEYFGRTFDGIVAWGLVFLLPPASQVRLIDRITAALAAEGSFLFTAPGQECSWEDVMTGRTSHSLGREQYAACLAEAGLAVVAEHGDDGGNHYFECRRRAVVLS